MKVLQELLREDREDRRDYENYLEKWRTVSRRDDLRRRKVLAILRRGQVRSPKDLFAAAFILHHGKEIGDFALASVLSRMAHQKGFQKSKNDPSALWLARAAKDRFLLHIGLPQKYRTQIAPAQAFRRQRPAAK